MGELLGPLLSKVQIGRPDECWPWIGARSANGYGNWHIRGVSNIVAHRAVYEYFRGPIPDGLTLDHLCHTRDTSCLGGRTCSHRLCCNPAHLEPVTIAENLRRGRGYCRACRGLGRVHRCATVVTRAYRALGGGAP